MRMKNIVLFGDSIRAGYDATVRGMLADIANVYYPGENCMYAAQVLRFLEAWMEAFPVQPTDVDCVHWNAGLWDTYIVDEDGPLTTLEAYKDSIRRICRKMTRLFPNARCIFAASTPMKTDTCAYRRNGDIERYNVAAMEIVRAYGMRVNDLYAFARTMPREWYSGTETGDQTHLYTTPAAVAFTRQVAASICTTLEIPVPEKSDGEILAHAPIHIQVIGI